tara:strand:- start:69 stop:416 length:348 start_codon:yes stop_codon:yes gene_type:complete
MSKLAKYLIFDLQEDWSKPSIKFFRSSGAYGYILWLTVVDNFYSEQNMTIDELVTKLEKYASRRTILDFIYRGVDAEFLKKEVFSKDKRKILIKPTDITIKEYAHWSEYFVKSVT